MELSDPVTTGTVVRPEPRIPEMQPCPSDNPPKVSHSTPNAEASSPTHQASQLTLLRMKPAEGSEQQNISELEAHSGLNVCLANTVSTCSTDDNASTADRDNTDNTTRLPTSDSRVVSVINDFSTKTGISVYSEHSVSTVSVSLTDFDTSVDKLGAFSKTAQLTTAGVFVERELIIEALTEGFAEAEGKVAQEGKAIVFPHTDQEAKSGGVMKHVKSITQLDEQPGFSQSSSQAAKSQEKRKGRLLGTGPNCVLYMIKTSYVCCVELFHRIPSFFFFIIFFHHILVYRHRQAQSTFGTIRYLSG